MKETYHLAEENMFINGDSESASTWRVTFGGGGGFHWWETALACSCHDQREADWQLEQQKLTVSQVWRLDVWSQGMGKADFFCGPPT